MGTLRDLSVYKKAYELAVSVFETSANFPIEEKYALTDQLRRSSRSVCANLAEAYRKRNYWKHFKSKISDAEMENAETEVWLDFAFSFNYIKKVEHVALINLNAEVGKMLSHMFNNPEKYGVKGND